MCPRAIQVRGWELSAIQNPHLRASLVLCPPRFSSNAGCTYFPRCYRLRKGSSKRPRRAAIFQLSPQLNVSFRELLQDLSPHSWSRSSICWCCAHPKKGTVCPQWVFSFLGTRAGVDLLAICLWRKTRIFVLYQEKLKEKPKIFPLGVMLASVSGLWGRWRSWHPKQPLDTF